MAKKIIKRYVRKRHTKHYHEHTNSVLGTMFGAGAVAVPLVSNNTGTGISVIEDLIYNTQNAMNGGYVNLSNLGMELRNGLMNNIGDVLVLGGTGVALAWLGKKFKINKLTKISKKWSIF